MTPEQEDDDELRLSLMAANLAIELHRLNDPQITKDIVDSFVRFYDKQKTTKLKQVNKYMANTLKLLSNTITLGTGANTVYNATLVNITAVSRVLITQANSGGTIGTVQVLGNTRLHSLRNQPTHLHQMMLRTAWR
jgi:hypothetical protein